MSFSFKSRQTLFEGGVRGTAFVAGYGITPELQVRIWYNYRFLLYYLIDNDMISCTNRAQVTTAWCTSQIGYRRSRTLLEPILILLVVDEHANADLIIWCVGWLRWVWPNRQLVWQHDIGTQWGCTIIAFMHIYWVAHWMTLCMNAMSWTCAMQHVRHSSVIHTKK